VIAEVARRSSDPGADHEMDLTGVDPERDVAKQRTP
jgi:hypothetical protein